MNTTKSILQARKEALIHDYLRGLEPRDIAVKYGSASVRNVYYHLRDLTHAQRVAARTARKARKAVQTQKARV